MKSCWTIIILLSAVSLLAQNRKFPQHTAYSTGIIPSMSRDSMDDAVRSFYKEWKARFIRSVPAEGFSYVYTRDPIPENEDTAESLSEGQGYGMEIVALMAGFDADAHKTFDELYKYYSLHPNKSNPVLMAWSQDSALNDIETDGATDGDIDIAFSLLLAHAQWGSSGKIDYLSRANAMIHAIDSQGINHQTYSILKGDTTKPDDPDYFDMRSSDFMPATFRSFYAFSKDSVWLKVIDHNYLLFIELQKEHSPSVGLLPDFIVKIHNGTGRPAPKRKKFLSKDSYEESPHDGEYYNNACRVPWRLATDYILNGDRDSSAKEALDNINTWVIRKTKGNPAHIAPGYKLNGKPFSGLEDKPEKFDAITYLGPFTVSAMVAGDKKWLDKCWTFLLYNKIQKFNYFDNTIKLLNMIIISGNYWDPAR